MSQQRFVTLVRRIPSNQSVAAKKAITDLKDRLSRAANSRTWKFSSQLMSDQDEKTGMWSFITILKAEKQRGKKDGEEKQWQKILETIDKYGKMSRFKDRPWEVVREGLVGEDEEFTDEDFLIATSMMDVVEEDDPQIKNSPKKSKNKANSKIKTEVINQDDFLPSRCASIEELQDRVLPEIEFLMADGDNNESDSRLASSPYFSRIYNRGPHIRSVLATVQRYLNTNGESRNHPLLYGLPGCAKTQIFRGVQSLLGEDAFVKLDATSTTAAGIYRLFFDKMPELYGDAVPAFWFFEEIEKTAEEALRVWLGVMDDRGEVIKVNYRQMNSRTVRLVCMSTCNDKEKLDRFMGGSLDDPGALSSRFVRQIKCPRPNSDEMRMILAREIKEKGGSESWIEPCIELAKEFSVDDPRQIIAYLDGENRLLNESFQKDQRDIRERANKVNALDN